MRHIISIFAGENKSGQIWLLATTSKNAKTAPFACWLRLSVMIDVKSDIVKPEFQTDMRKEDKGEHSQHSPLMLYFEDLDF
ncbi:MAG: hypothetical protein NC411_03905 [Bacteroides sp.]|nr:hypothetical protein [Bacteroides sp.]